MTATSSPGLRIADRRAGLRPMQGPAPSCVGPHVLKEGLLMERMTGAEFAARRHLLGLTLGEPAAALVVKPRTARAWESARDLIAESIPDKRDALLAEHAALVARMMVDERTVGHHPRQRVPAWQRSAWLVRGCHSPGTGRGAGPEGGVSGATAACRAPRCEQCAWSWGTGEGLSATASQQYGEVTVDDAVALHARLDGERSIPSRRRRLPRAGRTP